jgi:hypothetical protein
MPLLSSGSVYFPHYLQVAGWELAIAREVLQVRFAYLSNLAWLTQATF